MNKAKPLLLHIIDELPLTGAETHLLTMIQGSQRLFHFNHVVVSLFKDGPVGDKLREIGVPVKVLNLSPLVTKRRYFAAINEIRKCISEINPDLVEATLTWSRVLALPAARLCGIKNRFAFEQGDIYYRSWKWRILNFITQFFAQKIIVCSEALKQYDHRLYGFQNTRMEVFHNCLDTKKFGNFSGADDKLKFFGDHKKFIFCAVGSLGFGVNKRMDVIIRALAKIINDHGKSQVALVICGDGPQRQDLERLAADLKVTDAVKILGVRKDVDKVMSSCHAFCHASPFEPFGIVCLEAMWMGLPPIIPNSGGIREIVQPELDGMLYETLNHEDLASKMLKLIDNPAFTKNMAEKAREKVATTFSVDRYLKRLYEVTYKLTAEPNA